MPPFFAAKLKANGGNPADSMLARFGGSVTVGGVRIATVTAMHSNGLDPDYIGGDLGKAMKDAGIAGDVGLATGYVLRFSNGLVAYLSGDTGITADQELVVRNHYNAKLAVMNIGDGFTTGPAEAAYVINELVKPASVIASHANEVGTVGGKVRPGSKTEAFIKASKVPVAHPALGQDDGVRRRRASARRAAEPRTPRGFGNCGDGEGQRAFAVFVSGSSENTKLVLSSGLWQARHSAWLSPARGFMSGPKTA